MANTNNVPNELNLALEEYKLPADIKISVANWLRVEKTEFERNSQGVQNSTFFDVLSEIRPKNKSIGPIMLFLEVLALLIGVACVTLVFAPYKIIVTRILVISLISWIALVLSISSGFVIFAFFGSLYRKKACRNIAEIFETRVARLHSDPVYFVEQTIEYYKDKQLKFEDANWSISSKRTKLLDTPMAGYKNLKNATQEKLAEYKKADLETMPDRERRIQEAENQISYCDEQISNIEPLKRFVEVRNTRIKNKIELIGSKIELLKTLKTDLEAVVQIKTTVGLEYLEENYSALITKRRQEAVHRLCVDLDTLETEVSATANGISEIVQKVPMVSDVLLQRKYAA